MIKVAVKGFGTGWFWLDELELAVPFVRCERCDGIELA